ncbi:MAG: biopolymer transporter ExbD [Bacteriovoracia bacterium]
MAGVSVDGGGGNKLDVELNLVPFIDLLSTLTLFLLLTVVWVQIATIPASVDSKGGKSTMSATDDTNLQIHVTGSGVNLTWPGFLKGKFPNSISRGNLRSLNTTVAQAVKANLKVAAVSAEDGVEYGLVIEVIDMAKTAGVPTVALSTVH